MSLGSQDIAEAQAARQERERIELESRHDVEYTLFVTGFMRREVDDALLVARLRGKAEMEVAHEGIRATVTYVPGEYSVTASKEA